jgi:heme exporter protein C
MSSERPALRLFKFASPARFEQLAGWLTPPLWLAALLCGAAGLCVGFFVAPVDATQGEVYRILYIHVPAAWLSMLLYLALAFWATIGWAFKVRLASMLARAIAPTGALYTLLALWTGALWGQPTWGTWWVWDARLTSELVGSVNVPVIYFSVRWWNTLHQGATVSLASAPKMADSMLAAMLLCTLACWAHAGAVVLTRTRAIALEREADSAWAARLAGAAA